MTTTQSMELADTLIALLNRQRMLYDQLKDLAARQTELVDGSDPESLLKVLAARQRLIDQLTDIGKRAAFFTHGLK